MRRNAINRWLRGLLFALLTLGTANIAQGCSDHAAGREVTTQPSLECFAHETGMKGESPEELFSKPSLVVFWSTHCSPCLKELRRMNMLAQEHPEISFVWVSGQDDEKKIGKLADTLTAIHFIHDPDSTVWHEFNPESWGVAYAFDKSGTQFLKGYSSEITDGNINSIAMEKSITRRHSRIGYQFNFDTEVGFGAHEFSYIPHDNGEEVQLTNKSATSLVNYLLTSLYGNKVEIVERNEANASTPVKMIRLRLRYDEEQKKAAFERFLKMFCAGYGIVLDLEKSADGEVQKVIVDYSGYSG